MVLAVHFIVLCAVSCGLLSVLFLLLLAFSVLSFAASENKITDLLKVTDALSCFKPFLITIRNGRELNIFSRCLSYYQAVAAMTVTVFNS
jgi:hypothetical protein